MQTQLDHVDDSTRTCSSAVRPASAPLSSAPCDDRSSARLSGRRSQH